MCDDTYARMPNATPMMATSCNCCAVTDSTILVTDYQFQNVIFRQEGVAVPEVQTSVPAAGQYFVRVRATDSSGKTQDAFDYYVTDNGKNYGMKCFYVTADQRIEEDIYEEN